MMMIKMCLFAKLAEERKTALKPCQGKSKMSHNNNMHLLWVPSMEPDHV